jgi:hypothetical protein
VVAPGRFSTTTVIPRVRLICSASTRASVSELPPAEKGTTIFIVLLVWDQDHSHGSANDNTAVATIARMNRPSFGQGLARTFKTIGMLILFHFKT